jgi:hypothetical protein
LHAAECPLLAQNGRSIAETMRPLTRVPLYEPRSKGLSNDSLAKMTQFDFSRYGPTIEEFQRGLFNAKKRIRGFEIVEALA